MWYFDDLDCILVRLFLLCELYIENSFFIHLKKYVKALEYQNLMIHVIMIKSYLKFFLLGKPYFKKKNLWIPDMKSWWFPWHLQRERRKDHKLIMSSRYVWNPQNKNDIHTSSLSPPSPVNKNWTFLLYDSAGLFDIDFWI